MATYRGMDGSLYTQTGAAAPAANTLASTQTQEVMSWTLTITREQLEDTVLGDSSRTYKLGLKDWSGTVSVRFDGTTGAGQRTLIDNALEDNPSPIWFQFVMDDMTGQLKYFQGQAYPILNTVTSELGSIIPGEFNLIPASDLTLTWA